MSGGISGRPRRWKAVAVLAFTAFALGGCNSGGPVASVAPAQDTVSTKLANLLAFNATTAPGPAPGLPSQRLDCPIVQVEPGASSFRSSSGDSAAGVRYQIALGDVARDCARQGSNLAIRVGVETNLVLGPAGSPGAYNAPLRISVRRQSDEVTIASKTYRVGGTVGAGGSAQSSLVADALIVPWTNDRPDTEYEIVLAFGDGPAAGGGRRARR